MRLPELCDITYGFAFDSKHFTSDASRMPLIRIRDVKRGFSETFYDGNYSGDYVVRAGDLLIGMDGEFNIARWASHDALLNQRVCKVTAKLGVCEEYLRFALVKALKMVERRTAFVTVRHLSARELNKLELEMPDLAKQEEIASILVGLESVIALRRQQLESLDELVKARFVEMFGDVSRFTSAPLADSVEEMFIGPFGSSLKSDSFVPANRGFCMVYEQKHAIRKTIDLETRYVNEAKYQELQRFTVRGGDIIVSCRGTIGRTFIVPDDAPIGIMHPSIMKIRLKQNVYDRVFFDCLLQEVLGRHEAEANGSGVKMAITASALGKESFIRPSLRMQKEFAAFVAQVDKLKADVQKSLDETQLLFDSLMQKYFG